MSLSLGVFLRLDVLLGDTAQGVTAVTGGRLDQVILEGFFPTLSMIYGSAARAPALLWGQAPSSPPTPPHGHGAPLP